MRRGWWKALPSKLEKELEKLYQSDTRTVVPLKSRGYIHCKVSMPSYMYMCVVLLSSRILSIEAV